MASSVASSSGLRIAGRRRPGGIDPVHLDAVAAGDGLAEAAAQAQAVLDDLPERSRMAHGGVQAQPV